MARLNWRTCGPFLLGVLVGCGGDRVVQIAVDRMLSM